MSTLRERFLLFDDALAARGVPPLTDWWRAGIGEWLDRYERDHVLELWGCAGRGSAKSSALYKLCLFVSQAGDFQVPIGERHFGIILSRMQDEAKKGVQIIARWCALLGIGHKVANDVIEFDDQPRGIRVVAASVAATSGWRCFFVGRDERSKWAMGGVEELDAAEIDTSSAAMTATHPYAPVVSFGSAWARLGPFYDAITSGSDERKHVLGPAATWIAAPHIDEDSTRRKERDPRRWAREYACEFQSGVLSAFDPALVEAAFSQPIPGAPYDRCRRVFLLDPTAGGSDCYAFATAAWHIAPNHPPKLHIDWCGGIDKAANHYVSADLVKYVTEQARLKGCMWIHSDQFEKFSLGSAIAATGLKFQAHTWTAPLKERATERVREWLTDGTLVCGPPDPNSKFQFFQRMKRELIEFQETIAPSGQITFRGRRGGRDDFAMLILLCALVDLENQMPGSPLGQAERDARARWFNQRAVAAYKWASGDPMTGLTLSHDGKRLITTQQAVWEAQDRRVAGLSEEDQLKTLRGEMIPGTREFIEWNRAIGKNDDGSDKE